MQAIRAGHLHCDDAGICALSDGGRAGNGFPPRTACRRISGGDSPDHHRLSDSP